MDRPGHEQVDFFVGEEVEHTPAVGMRTLFVVGIQDTAEIHAKAMAYKCDHIYFGANQSFPADGSADWKSWENMIGLMLRSGLGGDHYYMCTLDLDVGLVEENSVQSEHGEDFSEDEVAKLDELEKNG